MTTFRLTLVEPNGERRAGSYNAADAPPYEGQRLDVRDGEDSECWVVKSLVPNEETDEIEVVCERGPD
ncbi:MAG: hypothetical protein WBB76_04890 [Gaiellaceae bacterium]